jgi:hypothetical protein
MGPSPGENHASPFWKGLPFSTRMISESPTRGAPITRITGRPTVPRVALPSNEDEATVVQPDWPRAAGAVIAASEIARHHA